MCSLARGYSHPAWDYHACKIFSSFVYHYLSPWCSATFKGLELADAFKLKISQQKHKLSQELSALMAEKYIFKGLELWKKGYFYSEMHPSQNNPALLLWALFSGFGGLRDILSPSTWKEETKFSSSKDCDPLGTQLPGLGETGLWEYLLEWKEKKKFCQVSTEKVRKAANEMKMTLSPNQNGLAFSPFASLTTGNH